MSCGLPPDRTMPPRLITGPSADAQTLLSKTTNHCRECETGLSGLFFSTKRPGNALEWVRLNQKEPAPVTAVAALQVQSP